MMCEAISSASATLNSPQGDGNSLLAGEIALNIDCQLPSIPRKGTETLGTASGFDTFLLQSATLNSPQGDGNWGLDQESGGLQLHCQLPSIPRKGTETH